MALPATPAPSEHQLLAWIEGFLKTLPRESRQRLGSPSGFVDPVRQALEQGRLDGSPWAREPKAFVEDHMATVAFRELLDKDRPLDDPWVIKQAAELCAEVLRSRDRAYRPRYGDLVDVAAAESLGWLSLIELAKKLWGGEEILNPRAYLRRIIEGDVSKLVEAAMRGGYPGDYAFRRLVKKEDKRLQQKQPDLARLERRALAATLIREELARGCHLLDRVAEGSLDSIADEKGRLPEQALSSRMVEEIDHLVENPSLTTPTDRDTWIRFKAADFRGSDIDWAGACSRHAGSQRLQALCRKLRRYLEDWR